MAYEVRMLPKMVSIGNWRQLDDCPFEGEVAGPDYGVTLTPHGAAYLYDALGNAPLPMEMQPVDGPRPGDVVTILGRVNDRQMGVACLLPVGVERSWGLDTIGQWEYLGGRGFVLKVGDLLLKEESLQLRAIPVLGEQKVDDAVAEQEGPVVPQALVDERIMNLFGDDEEEPAEAHTTTTDFYTAGVAPVGVAPAFDWLR